MPRRPPVRLARHMARLRKGDFRRQHQKEHRHGGQRQPGESGVIIMAQGIDAGHRQRSQERAQLIQRFIDAEGPAAPHMRARFRQHHDARRIARGLAHPLQHDQKRRYLPIARQRQRRHRQHLDQIAQSP